MAISVVNIKNSYSFIRKYLLHIWRNKTWIPKLIVLLFSCVLLDKSFYLFISNIVIYRYFLPIFINYRSLFSTLFCGLQEAWTILGQNMDTMMSFFNQRINFSLCSFKCINSDTHWVNRSEGINWLPGILPCAPFPGVIVAYSLLFLYFSIEEIYNIREIILCHPFFSRACKYYGNL